MCGLCIRPHLLCWRESASLAQSWPQSVWQRQTMVVGVHSGRCREASWHFLGDTPRGFATRHHSIRNEGGRHLCWNAFVPILVFHSMSVSMFLCFYITILALLLNSNKERGILVFVAASTVHAKISCLLV